LRELTPDTSIGFDVIDFAEAIGWPLDPWERFASIHAGELLPDGRPRFRVVLLLVARQNGKTLLARVWTLYWMFIERVAVVLGLSASRDYAKKSWREVIKMAEATPVLADELPAKHTVEGTGSEEFFTGAGSSYFFAASNRRAGRSLTVNRAVMDELREHRNWDAWDAAKNAMNAVADAQTFILTNQGDDTSVVLDALHAAALDFIETGNGDPRLGLLEWSAPAGSSPTDLEALAQANPDLGNRILVDSLYGDAVRAERAGGEQLARFRTEVMCMRVHQRVSAIDPDLWAQCGTDAPLDLAGHRRRTAVCVDVAIDGSHATAVAAATVHGVTHVEVVGAWAGLRCTARMRAELPALIRRIRPARLGWFPTGPAAAVAADLATRKGTAEMRWPPRGTTAEELTSHATAVCMGLADAVAGGDIAHPRDDMLTGHVGATQPLRRGDGWVFARRDCAPIDGAYALAGAVHLARTMPQPRTPLRVLTSAPNDTRQD
jgi:hypothetical protein